MTDCRHKSHEKVSTVRKQHEYKKNGTVRVDQYQYIKNTGFDNGWPTDTRSQCANGKKIVDLQGLSLTDIRSFHLYPCTYISIARGVARWAIVRRDAMATMLLMLTQATCPFDKIRRKYRHCYSTGGTRLRHEKHEVFFMLQMRDWTFLPSAIVRCHQYWYNPESYIGLHY